MHFRERTSSRTLGDKNQKRVMRKLFSLRQVCLDVLLLALVGALLFWFSLHCRQAALLDLLAQVELGEDLGQPVGTLFELVGEDGHVVGGAGFSDAFGTRIRQNNRVLEFFLKTGEKPLVEPLGKPLENCYWLSCFSADGKLNFTRTPELKTLIYTQRVNNKDLEFHTTHISYDGQKIFEAPSKWLNEGFYLAPAFYFSNGLLVVCMHDKKRVKCFFWGGQWKPGAKVEPPQRIMTDEIPLTFGTYKGAVIVGGNSGGVYRFDGRWSVIMGPSKESSQFYSMLPYYDRLYIGHWPTGAIFQYDGLSVTRATSSPPPIEGVSSEGRELQSLQLYGGELYAGLWPWGELWRMSTEGEWKPLGRLFRFPVEVNDRPTPYYERLQTSDWGQRIVSLAVHNNSLYASTANVRGEKTHSGDLSAAELAEYGSLFCIARPTVLAREIVWKRRTEIRFQVTERSMSLYQDGELLAERAIPPQTAQRLKVQVGKGVYGPFTGPGLRVSSQNNLHKIAP